MPPIKKRLISSLAGLMSLLPVFDASAVVLGEIRSASRLGELLHAEIDIDDDPADRFDASCVKLYRPAQASGDQPWITEARLSFRHENGKGKLYISSDFPLRNPVVQIGVESNCPGGQVWREYTVSTPSQAATVRPEAALAVQAASPSVPGLPEKKISRVTRQASPSFTGEAAPRPGMEIASPARKADGISANGGRRRNRELALQMALEVSASPSATASPSEAERDLLRLEYRTLTALQEQSDSQLALTEARLRLQRESRELKAAGELPGVSTAVAPAPPQAPALAPAPAPAPVSETVEPTVVQAAVTSPPSAAPEPVAQPVIPESIPEPLPPEITEESSDWPLYAGSVIAILSVLVLVMLRRRATIESDELPMDEATIIVNKQISSASQEKAMVLPAEQADQAPTPPNQQAIAQLLDRVEFAPPMELAEIMLSFGRIEGAAQTLQEYIRTNPQEALQRWISQLENYRVNGKCTEFETLAADLNHNFNVEILRWDNAAPGERLEMTLELLPHIRDQIDAMWGTPECLEYLQSLLKDNREGQRNGFALPIVREILILIELMEAEKAVA